MGKQIIIVAAIGVVINTLTALLFIKGQKNDLNIKGAFLHNARLELANQATAGFFAVSVRNTNLHNRQPI